MKLSLESEERRTNGARDGNQDDDVCVPMHIFYIQQYVTPTNVGRYNSN
jgi:hypothetical protein